MKRQGSVVTMAVLLAMSSAVFAQQGGKLIVEPHDGLKWTPGAVPGVSICAVDGDMAKGPSHFYLKYGAGLVTPLHHHSADHYVTTVSGTLVLVVDGKEHRLPPGSYFALTGKKAHVARCEGKDDCVMFLDARGSWDVVPEEKPAPKH